MKYQIYLNKDTSMLVNKLAEKNSKKPATVIKEIMESLQRLSKPLESELLKNEQKR